MRNSLIVIVVVLATLAAFSAIGQSINCQLHRFNTQTVIQKDSPVPDNSYNIHAGIHLRLLNDGCHEMTVLSVDEDYADTLDYKRTLVCANKGEIHLFQVYTAPNYIVIFDSRMDGSVEAVFNYEIRLLAQVMAYPNDAGCYFARELNSQPPVIIWYNEEEQE